MNMRDLITLCEARQGIDPALINALRHWGENTVFDRGEKEQMLRQLAHLTAEHAREHEWLYRGQCVEPADIAALKKGRAISIDLGGDLSSWTPDSDRARTFAQFSGAEASIVIMKQGLKPYFDFSAFGEVLKANGMFPDSEDYPLHDPIREEEVIVDHPRTININKNDVLEWFAFDDHGERVNGHFQ
jgi:hypothetical protein